MMDNQLIAEVYNLILEKELTDEERAILIRCKASITQDCHQERVLMDLSESLRRLSVENIAKGKTLSPKLAKFYKAIATYREDQKHLARGLISMRVWLGR